MQDLPEHIELTSDQELRAKLGRKLEAYAKRYGARSEEDNKKRPPYKWLVLRELLVEEQVDVSALAERLRQEYGLHDAERYGNAIHVIGNYNSGNILQNHGSAGFE